MCNQASKYSEICSDDDDDDDVIRRVAFYKRHHLDGETENPLGSIYLNKTLIKSYSSRSHTDTMCHRYDMQLLIYLYEVQDSHFYNLHDLS